MQKFTISGHGFCPFYYVRMFNSLPTFLVRYADYPAVFAVASAEANYRRGNI
jgi:hypothetical protein